MAENDRPLTVSARFPRRPTRGVLLGFSASRLVAVAVAGALALGALVAAGVLGLAASSVIWVPLLATAFARWGGRPLAEWAASSLHYGGRRLAGQTEYRSRLPLRPRPGGTLALPGDAASLRFWADPVSGAAMVHDPHRRTMTAVLPVSHPAFVLLDHDDQAQRVSRWGRLQAALSQSMSVSALQVLEAVVPDRGDGALAWYDERGNRGGGWADGQYRALLDQARLGSSAHRTTVSLALDLRAAARAVKAAGGGMAGAAAVLRQDLSSLAGSLRDAGLGAGAPLGEAELAAMVRAAYDPASLVGPNDGTGTSLSAAGPLAVSEQWDCLRHDSGWSAVLWVSEWPRVDVPPDFLHALVFAPGVRRSLSLVLRPLPAEAALRQIRKDKTGALADQAQKARVGQVADLSDEAEYADLLARERSVIAGHTDVCFSGFVAVSAPSRSELASATAAVVRAAAVSACEVRPLYGRQAQGFVLAALPLARSAF
jgi:hypothetical protein